MHMNKYHFIVALLVSAFALNSQAAGDPKAGQEKSKPCAACHGADGNSVSPGWPKLAGQHPGYLSLQLHHFKSGERVNAQMAPIVANLSDQDIEDLAAYFSSQKIKLGKAKADLVALGAKIYRAGNADTGVPACLACHGPRGSGNPAAQYPSLSGQHSAYVEAQLNAFRTGLRKNEIMHTIAGKMNDNEIKAVASFLQGLH